MARDLAVAAAALLGAAYLVAPAFVPLVSAPATAPALRGAGAAVPGATSAPLCATTALACACCAAAVGAASLRRCARLPPATVRHARDLAVAYQDAGIDLSDNGKFAQGLVGSEGAWGPYEFDPAGFSKNTEFLPYFREAELKHGRIAMLAWLGLVVPSFVRIPGEAYSFEKVPRVLDAHDAVNGNSDASGAGFQILLFISIVELCCAKKVFEWNSLECAGDYGLRNLLPKDAEGEKRMRLAELKNGRLAMIAFGGAVTQMAITGNDFPWLY